MDNPMLIDIKMDMTHGDILYYESGDFFGKHRDIIPKCHIIHIIIFIQD